MNAFVSLLFVLLLGSFVTACEKSPTSVEEPTTSQENAVEAEQSASKVSEPNTESDFVWSPERFADVKMIRYQLPGFSELNLEQKQLVYYLVQAGLAGRDIMWDQNYRHNLVIRRALEAIIEQHVEGEQDEEWAELMLYARRVFFSNGIHHHNSGDKFTPGFSEQFFADQLHRVGLTLSDEVLRAIYDPEFDAKKVNLDSTKDLVKGSAINFYDPDISDADAEEFYAGKTDEDAQRPVLHGLNSKLVRSADGSLKEKVWKADGMYGPAITQIISWLEKAITVAENAAQGDALKLLVEYYKSGDLKTWDAYNIAWTAATEGDVDYIHSFIEVYQDPKGYKGAFENIVQIKDFEASRRMQVVAKDAQWFEDNSTTDPAHKKDKVVGVSYNVVSVAGLAGDASPSSPVGVNLPNSNWIRAEYGSKSVSLGNIVNAYSQSSDPGLLAEFAYDQKQIDRNKEHRELAGKMRTALHEVIGHASGKLEDGVGTPKETLKNYSSALEEARADLVALYYVMDPRMVELNLIPSLETGRAAYDSFILNGKMLQLRRIEPGKSIEQAHMRNRQMISGWVFEKGQDDNVISKIVRDNKSYFVINDYEKLRGLFGKLLKEVQRIKSQGDYNAGRELIENYGVQVDQALHNEVLARAKPLNVPPYGGFINPKLVPVEDQEGRIVDVRVDYPADFIGQMLEYGKHYSYLPDYN